MNRFRPTWTDFLNGANLSETFVLSLNARTLGATVAVPLTPGTILLPGCRIDTVVLGMIVETNWAAFALLQHQHFALGIFVTLLGYATYVAILALARFALIGLPRLA